MTLQEFKTLTIPLFNMLSWAKSIFLARVLLRNAAGAAKEVHRIDWSYTSKLLKYEKQNFFVERCLPAIVKIERLVKKVSPRSSHSYGLMHQTLPIINSMSKQCWHERISYWIPRRSAQNIVMPVKANGSKGHTVSTKHLSSLTQASITAFVPPSLFSYQSCCNSCFFGRNAAKQVANLALRRVNNSGLAKDTATLFCEQLVWETGTTFLAPPKVTGVRKCAAGLSPSLELPFALLELVKPTIRYNDFFFRQLDSDVVWFCEGRYSNKKVIFTGAHNAYNVTVCSIEKGANCHSFWSQSISQSPVNLNGCYTTLFSFKRCNGHKRFHSSSGNDYFGTRKALLVMPFVKVIYSFKGALSLSAEPENFDAKFSGRMWESEDGLAIIQLVAKESGWKASKERNFRNQQSRLTFSK